MKGLTGQPEDGLHRAFVHLRAPARAGGRIAHGERSMGNQCQWPGGALTVT